jgi:hypothetical protein
MATSPTVMIPLRCDFSVADASKEPADRAAPAMPTPLRKERRLTPFLFAEPDVDPDEDSVVSDDAVGTRLSCVMS